MARCPSRLPKVVLAFFSLLQLQMPATDGARSTEGELILQMRCICILPRLQQELRRLCLAKHALHFDVKFSPSSALAAQRGPKDHAMLSDVLLLFHFVE